MLFIEIFISIYIYNMNILGLKINNTFVNNFDLYKLFDFLSKNDLRLTSLGNKKYSILTKNDIKCEINKNELKKYKFEKIYDGV